MKRKLLFTIAALLCTVGTWAQGTWTAPVVPGADFSSLDGSTNYYLYNVGSDAFVTYGMSWNTNAIARRLSSGDQSESAIHAMTATNPSAGTARFHLNDVTSGRGIGTNQAYCDVWVDFNSNYDWSYAPSESVSGAYTLTMGGNKLDVSWAYGGHLTTTGGQGFYDWALIPVTSITDGSYAKYKERKQMYEVYLALVAADVVSSYTQDLETANSVYVNSSATVSDLRTATRTLINAAAEDIASSINGNSLFDDADMWGNQAISTWTSTAPSNDTGGEYETYNVHYDFNQTHEVPNGSYKIVFHSLFRNDGGGAAPRIVVTDGELDGGGTTASANVPLFTSLSFEPNVNNNSGDAITGSDKKNGYYSDWVQNGGVWIPNGRRSSADALAHTDAVAAVDNFKVTTGKMNIRLIIDQNSQWVNFQGFDIIFYGSTTGKLYRDLVALLAISTEYSSEEMGTTEADAISRVLSDYASYTKSNSESELEAAIADVTAVNAAAAASIARTAHVAAITSNKGDITSLINGTFNTNTDGWTGGNHVTGLARSWRSASDTNPFMERTSNGTMSCTLANMPAGTYKVVAASRAAAGCTITPRIAGTAGTGLTGVGDTQSAASEINLNGVQMPYSALGGFTTNDSGHNWQWITATGTLSNNGNLVIEFICNADEKTGNDSWMPIDDVHLYCTNLDGTSYTTSLNGISANADVVNTNNGSVVTCDIVVSNPNVVFKSNSGVAITTASGQNLNNCLYHTTAWYMTKMVLYDGYAFEDMRVSHGGYQYFAQADGDNSCTLYRNIPADTWCTLTIPFWPRTTLEKKYPSAFDSETGVLTFSDVTTATCWNNEPMLIKSSTALTAITGKRQGNTKGEASGVTYGDMTSGEGVNMNGTYTAISEVPQGSYVVARVDDADALYKVNSPVSLAPFRAYFTVPAESGVKASVIRLNFDGMTTGIEAIDHAQPALSNAPIFNLAGQRVQKAQRGLYIQNGKKVLVK